MPSALQLARWGVRAASGGSTLPRRAAILLQLEMILQAHEYETGQSMTLQEFYDSTAGKWRTELGRSWAEEIYRRREAARSSTEGVQAQQK